MVLNLKVMGCSLYVNKLGQSGENLGEQIRISRFR